MNKGRSGTENDEFAENIIIMFGKNVLGRREDNCWWTRTIHLAMKRNQIESQSGTGKITKPISFLFCLGLQTLVKCTE